MYMYSPPLPLEQPPMADPTRPPIYPDRPGVRALRGARPQITPEMQRMRDWANSQRAATAANARNGDFILNPAGSGGAPVGVGIPTQMPGRWESTSNAPKPDAGAHEDRLPIKPDRPTTAPVKPGMEPPPDKRGRLTGRRG